MSLCAVEDDDGFVVAAVEPMESSSADDYEMSMLVKTPTMLNKFFFVITSVQVKEEE